MRLSVCSVLGIFIVGCSTLKESLIVGASAGGVAGAIAGNQSRGDRSENVIKGAVIGGLVGGIVSYVIHNSLEKRDAEVRRDTLMNLEHYEVLGVGDINTNGKKVYNRKCLTTREVDGRMVSIPCELTNE